MITVSSLSSLFKEIEYSHVSFFIKVINSSNHYYFITEDISLGILIEYSNSDKTTKWFPGGIT